MMIDLGKDREVEAGAQNRWDENTQHTNIHTYTHTHRQTDTINHRTYYVVRVSIISTTYRYYFRFSL